MKKAIAIAALVVALASISVGQAAAAPTAASKSSGTASIRVPNVVGLRMDMATRLLRSKGLRVNEECSGIFGCIIKANWWVCEQMPRPGGRVGKYSVVVTYAERRGEC